MAPHHVWKFSCDHQFTMAKYEPSSPDLKQKSSPVEARVVRTVPNQCPECVWAVQEAEKEKELLAKNEAALVAHKEHGEFLKTQFAKSAGDSALIEVFTKLLDDCVLLQAEKAVYILLAQDKDFNKPGSDGLRMIKAAAENFKIMQNANDIQSVREAAHSGARSIETWRLQDEVQSWYDLNASIDRLCGNNGLNYILPSYNQAETDRCWKLAVKLAKGMKLSR